MARETSVARAAKDEESFIVVEVEMCGRSEVEEKIRIKIRGKNKRRKRRRENWSRGLEKQNTPTLDLI